MANDVKRSTRVAERLREEISALIARELNDPRLSGAIVVRVTMPDDLHTAKVFFRMLTGGTDTEKRKEVATGFERASGMIRREVTRRLSLRHAPELSFVYDDGQEKTDRIEGLLYEVREDLKKKPTG